MFVYFLYQILTPVEIHKTPKHEQQCLHQQPLHLFVFADMISKARRTDNAYIM